MSSRTQRNENLSGYLLDEDGFDGDGSDSSDGDSSEASFESTDESK